MIGFQEQEIQAFRSVMLEMDADMVKVDSVNSCKLCFQQHISSSKSGLQIIVCDRRMFQQTLRQALEAPGHMHTEVSVNSILQCVIETCKLALKLKQQASRLLVHSIPLCNAYMLC